MVERRTEYLPLDDIQFALRNPKRHAEAQIRRSIDTFGVGELPLLDERTGRLVAGHGRIEQLRAMRDAQQSPPDGVTVDGQGRWLVPVNRGWQSRSDAEAEAYLLASNQLTIRGGWEDDALGGVLRDLQDTDPDLALLAGWPQDELDAIIAGLDDAPEDEDPDGSDNVPAAPAGTPRTQPGDVWLLGPHRIICGDCRDYSTIERLMDGRQVNMAFTSPPYSSQRKYDESSGFKPIHPDGYVDWFEDVQANIRAVLAPDGSWFVNIKEHCDDGQRHLYVKDLTIAHVRQWGWRFVDELCWVDSRNGFPGTWPNRFKDAWEPVFHFSVNAQIKFDALANGLPTENLIVFDSKTNISANDGKGGGYSVSKQPREVTSGLARPSNVIHVSAGGEGTHSAAFPVALPAWFIRAYTDPGDAVCDPFMGSGTTLLAAHNEDRVGFGVEISPGYCDLICRRFQTVTGIVPILESTGEEVDFTATAGS